MKDSVCLPNEPGDLEVEGLVHRHSLLDIFKRDSNPVLESHYTQDAGVQNHRHNRRHQRPQKSSAAGFTPILCCEESCSIKYICDSCGSGLPLDECRKRATWRLPLDYFVSSRARSRLFMLPNTEHVTMEITEITRHRGPQLKWHFVPWVMNVLLLWYAMPCLWKRRSEARIVI